MEVILKLALILLQNMIWLNLPRSLYGKSFSMIQEAESFHTFGQDLHQSKMKILDLRALLKQLKH